MCNRSRRRRRRRSSMITWWHDGRRGGASNRWRSRFGEGESVLDENSDVFDWRIVLQPGHACSVVPV
jgi:hypothetical protein